MLAELDPLTVSFKQRDSSRAAFVGPLAAIHPSLRAAASAATALVYAEIRDAAACIDLRRNALLFLAHPDVWSFIDRLRPDGRSDEETGIYYRGISQALVGVSTSSRHMALKVTQILVASKNPSSQVLDHLLVLDNITRFVSNGHTASPVDFLDAAVRTRLIMQAESNIVETITIFFALAQCSQGERKDACQLPRQVIPTQMRLPRRDVLVTQAIALGIEEGQRIIRLMAPYVCGPGQDERTTCMIFLGLAYAHQHGLADNIETSMHHWAEASGFADAPACAAATVLYGLQQMIRDHRTLNAKPPSSSDLYLATDIDSRAAFGQLRKKGRMLRH